jgi:hypothetical protein
MCAERVRRWGERRGECVSGHRCVVVVEAQEKQESRRPFLSLLFSIKGQRIWYWTFSASSKSGNGLTLYMSSGTAVDVEVKREGGREGGVGYEI